MKWWEEKEKGSEGKGKEWEMKWNQPVRDRPLSEIPKAKCAHVYAVFCLSLRISHTPPLYTVYKHYLENPHSDTISSHYNLQHNSLQFVPWHCKTTRELQT